MLINREVHFQIKNAKKQKFSLSAEDFVYGEKVLKTGKVYDPILKTRLDCLFVGYFFVREVIDGGLNVYVCPILNRAFHFDEVENKHTIITDIYKGSLEDIFGFPLQGEISTADTAVPMIDYKTKVSTFDLKGSTIEEALQRHNEAYVSAECFYIQYKENLNDPFIIDGFIKNSLMELVG